MSLLESYSGILEIPLVASSRISLPFRKVHVMHVDTKSQINHVSTLTHFP